MNWYGLNIPGKRIVSIANAFPTVDYKISRVLNAIFFILFVRRICFPLFTKSIDGLSSSYNKGNQASNLHCHLDCSTSWANLRWFCAWDLSWVDVISNYFLSLLNGYCADYRIEGFQSTLIWTYSAHFFQTTKLRVFNELWCKPVQLTAHALLLLYYHVIVIHLIWRLNIMLDSCYCHFWLRCWHSQCAFFQLPSSSNNPRSFRIWIVYSKQPTAYRVWNGKHW